MTDEESMALCAIRYTLGRSSYIVVSGFDWARKWGQKSDTLRPIIIRDIETELAHGVMAFQDIRGDWIEVLVFLRKIENENKEKSP